MKYFLVIIFVAVLSGCGHVKVVKDADSFEASTWTLFKNIEQVQGVRTEEETQFSLGSSTSTEEASALFLVCTINPGLPICMTD